MEGGYRSNNHSVEGAQTPLIENMVVGVPPVFEGLTREIDQLIEQPLLGPKTEFPPGKQAVQVLKAILTFR